MTKLGNAAAAAPIVLALAFAGTLFLAGQDAGDAIPDDAVAFGNHHYLLVDEVEDLSWSNARQACADRNATLAVITTRDEAEFIGELCEGRYMYLGATDEAEEGSWIWIEGSEWDFTYWMDGQPNDYSGHENYLATYDDGEWVDVDADGEGFWMPTGYICEWDLSLGLAAGDDGPPSGHPEIEPVPGQLDVVEMTAVELDGRLPEDVEPTAYAWRILEGEGGKLFKSDQQDAVFLAPKVERGVRQFILELTVSYADQPSSVRRLRIRVVPTDPAAALDDSAPDDTAWLDDFYGGMREAQEGKGGSQIVVPRSSGGPTVSIGVRGGSRGWRGGVGIRVPLSYPVTQPVDVPAPGRSSMPGEGEWDAATPVPYDQLGATFPPDIAERYKIVEDREPPEVETETEQD